MIIRHVIRYVFDSSLFLGIVGAASNVIIAGFSILIWRVYRNQLATMRDALKETRTSNEATQTSNEIAERSMVLGRRSWLVPATFVAPNTFVPDQPWEFHIEIVNCGGIPATNVVSKFSVILATIPEPLPEEIEFKADGPVGVITIAPGKAQATGVGQSLILPKSTLDKIMTNKVALYIYLHLDYRDGLLDSSEPNRWASGCWRFYTERDNWATAEKHNNAP